MKKCQYCEVECFDISEKCPNCGRPLPVTTQKDLKTEQEHLPSYTPPSQPPSIEYCPPVRSSMFRVAAIITAILGIISGIVLGFYYPTVEILSSLRAETHFNGVLMIAVWVSFGILALIFWGIYGVLKNQEFIIFKNE